MILDEKFEDRTLRFIGLVDEENANDKTGWVAAPYNRSIIDTNKNLLQFAFKPRSIFLFKHLGMFRHETSADKIFSPMY